MSEPSTLKTQPLRLLSSHCAIQPTHQWSPNREAQQCLPERILPTHTQPSLERGLVCGKAPQVILICPSTCEIHVFLLTPSLTPSFLLHLFFIYLFRSVQTHRLFYSVGYDTVLSFILMLRLCQYWPLRAPFSWLFCLL